MRAVAHDETRQPLAARRETVKLLKERLGVHHDAVSYHTGLTGIEYAGGQKVEYILLIVDDDGVARVRAALIADDDPGLRGEHIDHAALALVSPLYSQNDICATFH